MVPSILYTVACPEPEKRCINSLYSRLTRSLTRVGGSLRDRRIATHVTVKIQNLNAFETQNVTASDCSVKL